MPAEPFPGIPEINLERDAPCRLRDGVTLYADVYRPAGDGPHPVLLMRTPYGKTGGESDVGYAHPSWYARHGYVVAVQDCRGRFASEGTFYPFLYEAADGYESVEWAARLSGGNGKVAMYGFSYVGATQLLAATLRPSSLVTICPGFTASQYYEGWTYNGGAFALAFAALWALGLAYETARRAGDDATLDEIGGAFAGLQGVYGAFPLREQTVLARHAPFYLDWLEHSAYDDYWRRWSIDEDYARIEVPALHVAGWWDVFLSGSIANFAGLSALGGAAQKLLVGPWYHCPWTPLDPTGPSGQVIDDWQLRWLDHFLKGRETGVLDAPATVWVEGEGWRDLDGWPPSSSRPVDWFLHSGGRANSAFGDGTLSPEPPGDEPADVFVYDPSFPAPSRGGHSCCFEDAPMGPAAQNATEALGTVLVYTSAPLERDLVLVGDASVTLHAASSARDTDFTARLCTVAPDGRSTNLQEGIIRARFRDSLTEPKPLRPGEAYEYRIELGPLGVRIAAGQRLRLDVSSSDFPQWDRNLNTGGALGTESASAAVTATQVVLHDRSRPSRVTLPVAS